MNVKVTLNPQKVSKLLASVTNDSAQKAAVVTVQRARNNLIRADRMDTGALYRSIGLRARLRSPVLTVYEVSAGQPYAIFQERGTRGSVAKPGKVLRFKPKGSNVFIFRPRTGPVRPAWFMRDAYRSLRVEDFVP